MKKTIYILLCASILLFSCNKQKDDSEKSPEQLEQTASTEKKKEEAYTIEKQHAPDTLKGSLQAVATGKIGNAEITISYYSPAVRGRTIWGGLVAYDNVWVTGAHKATNIKFDKDIKIGDTVVAAGTYAFFTIPGKEEWTIILNKNWNQHLADEYSQADDILRFNVVPEIDENQQERLRYVIERESDTVGEIVMYWEKIEIALPFEVVGK